MYKLAIILLLFLLPNTPVLAADLSLGTWHTTGYLDWRTTFPLHTEATIDGASELHYPYSANYIICAYNNRLTPKKSLQITAGILNNPKTNIGSDSDWDYSQSNNLWYYGEFNTKPQGHFITIDWHQQNSSNSDFFYGYSYNMTKYNMTNGIYYIDNYGTVNNSLSNLGSYYSITYQGPHIGIRHSNKITPNLAAVTSLTYSPFALAQGHGWWNLRDLQFDHTGSAQMLDFDAGLRTGIGQNKENNSVTLGYRYQYFKLLKGFENLSSSISWDKATNIQKGFYLTGAMKF